MPVKTVAIVRPGWRDFLALCKLRVVSVLLVTALVGMLLASDRVPGGGLMLAGLIGIGLLAASAAALNHLIDRKLDAQMYRTRRRPLPQGRVSPQQALGFAFLLACAGMLVLVLWVNWLTAWLTLAALIGYAVVYTLYLKRATPQNIVIGGLAGAAPPLLGWVAVSGSVEAEPLLLVAIVFVWTPPHFWSLCIHKQAEYARAGVPMMPVTHGGRHTRRQILLYTLLLMLVTLLPFFHGGSGWPYLLGVSLINLRFLYWACKLLDRNDRSASLATFIFSIKYILLLFLCLLLDHYLRLFSGF